MPALVGDGPPMPWRGPHRRRSRSGAMLSVRIGLLQVVGTALAAHGHGDRRSLDAVAYLLLGAGPAALAARRRAPLTVLALNLATTGSYYALDYRYGPAFLGLFVAVFTAVERAAGRHVVTLIAAGFAGYSALSVLLDREPRSIGRLIATAALLSFVVMLAEAMHSGRERGRAAAQAASEQRRRRASEERLRIAQELHDTLGHHLSVINVQAGVALHLGGEQADSALVAIKQASHEALDELRDVLSILRNDQEAPRAPTPTLARLDELVEQSRAAGLPVQLQRDDDARPLPPAVDRAAYRIVQEALTNVRRHAEASRARVNLRRGDAALLVEITDDGRSDGLVAEEGNGIEGMRTRATALGGTLELDRAPAGGLRVRAVLPLVTP
jgi:signal transduction histidine kinase